jgi:hypothetical protein
MNKNLYTPVRFSHLTGYSGVGAIVRGVEEKLMVIVDTRYWTDKMGTSATQEIPFVKRIIQALGISEKELRMPPIAGEDSHKGIKGSYIPAQVFPTYATCKKCNRLHPNPWREQGKGLNEEVHCEHCRGLLEQGTLCCINTQGYLDEVPWHTICHTNSSQDCKQDYKASYLEFTTGNDGKKIIKCTKCGSSHRYENEKIGFIGKQQPWVQEPPSEGIEQVSIIEVNDSSVYLPEVESALIIPPESRIDKNSVVYRLYNNSTKLRELKKVEGFERRGEVKKLATMYQCTEVQVESALKEIDKGYPYLADISLSGDLLQEEYKAFLTPIENVRDDEDFVPDHQTQQWKNLKEQFTIQEQGDLSALISLVDKHIIVKRLREIVVFKGFRRGFSDDKESEQEQLAQQKLVPPDIVGESDWLPAIELFGEGVFFTLNENLLSQWESEKAVKSRVEEFATKYEYSTLLSEDITISPRFILLHTLAHLIIRELEISAGYPAASLKERIYHSRDSRMAGILIYTAVPDIVGSLGGIIESAEPKEWLKILSNAFNNARWCSLDPVCGEHQGQGASGLNRAACHACCLVPETSCNYQNSFLDRVFIKGNKAEGIPNLLAFVRNHNGRAKI